MELMSTTMDPRFAPSMMPFSPRTTCFTCGELGSIVMMMSVCSATCLRSGGGCGARGDDLIHRRLYQVANH